MSKLTNNVEEAKASTLLHSDENQEKEIIVINPLKDIKFKYILDELDHYDLDWYEDKNIGIYFISGEIITEEQTICMSHFFVDSTPDKHITFANPKEGIRFPDLHSPFWSKENFFNGVKYISQMADKKTKSKCFKFLNKINKNYEINAYLNNASFFCEVGLWENAELRDSNLYDNDFSKYLKNCLDVYHPSNTKNSKEY